MFPLPGNRMDKASFKATKAFVEKPSLKTCINMLKKFSCTHLECRQCMLSADEYSKNKMIEECSPRKEDGGDGLALFYLLDFLWRVGTGVPNIKARFV